VFGILYKKGYEPQDEGSLSQEEMENLLKTRKKDQQALTLINQCFDDHIF